MRPATFDDVLRLTAPSDARISPDGTRVAYVVTTVDADGDSYRTTIWVAGDGEPRQLTSGPADSAPRWSPDGSVLAFVAKRGDGAAQLHRLPLDGGEAQRLTELPLGAGAAAWSADGTRIAFSAPVSLEPDRKPTDPIVVDRMGFKADGSGIVAYLRTHLFVMPADGSEPPTQITEGDWSAMGPVWSPDGATIVCSASIGDDRDIDHDTTLLAVPSTGGDPTRLTPSRQAAGAFFTDDGGIVYCGSATITPGHALLLRADPAGGEPTRLVADLDRNVMVGGPGYPGAPPAQGAPGHVVFCARDRGVTHAFVTDLTGGPATPLVGGWERSVSGLTTAPAAGRMAYVVASPTSPGEVCIANLDGTDEKQLTDLTAQALADVSLFTPAERMFAAPDGTPIHGWVIRDPAAEKPSPLLLDVHGGPHNAWGPTFDGAHIYHQVLAAQGWIVLIINPRGSDGYGEGFYTSVVGAWGQADMADFLCAVDTLVAEGTADNEQLAITGYSYGGYTTCRLTSSTDRFKAAVGGGVVCDLASEFGTADLGYWLGAEEVGGLPSDQPDRYAASSPITDIGQVTTPTLLLHGEADDRCPVSQAEQWFAGLRARKVPTQLVRYPGASHLFILNGRPSHRVDYSRRLVDWITTYVTA